MPRITEQRQEATRQRILQGARRVFVEKGFHEATIDDLVAECGLSVGAIYGYFKGKDELIRASILAANRQESDAVLEDTQAAGTVREKMERAIRGWWAYTIETPGGPAFLAEAWAAASRRPLSAISSPGDASASSRWSRSSAEKASPAGTWIPTSMSTRSPARSPRCSTAWSWNASTLGIP